MKIIESIMYNNPCYKAMGKIKPQGLMLHSVGCPQVKALPFVNAWNTPTYTAAAVHGFIDGLTGDIYQTLPWDHKAWHAGKGANSTHIGVEMCEPSTIQYIGGATFKCSNLSNAREVAMRTYNAAVELFAYLANMYNLDPLADGVIISHREGYLRGIASNHGDPDHLWSQLGMDVNMNTFRHAVKELMEEEYQVRYNRISEMPTWAQPTVAKLVDDGTLNGNGSPERDESGRPIDLNLSQDMLRMLVIMDRKDLFNKFPGYHVN